MDTETFKRALERILAKPDPRPLTKKEHQMLELRLLRTESDPDPMAERLLEM